MKIPKTYPNGIKAPNPFTVAQRTSKKYLFNVTI